MRWIDSALQAKFQSDLQTKANNADPAAVVWINRPTTALTDPEFLEQEAVGVTSGLTALDVAIRRTQRGREPDRAFVAYVSAGTAGVRSGELVPDVHKIVWTQESFAETADDVAICFDGTMPSAADGRAEFVTEARPWVFWTHDGELTGRILGLLGDTQLAASNCTKVTAIRATGGVQDFGLVVFFLLNGAIYYRQHIDGEWTDAEAVAFGPAGVTWADIAAFRTWDYRVGLQAVTTGGDVYELFTQFMGVARHGAEHIALDAMAHGDIIPVQTLNTQENEHISLAAVASSGPYGGLYRTGAPSLVQAYNVAVGGDYGKKAVFGFDRHLVADEVAAQNTAFRIVDANGRIFVAQTATLMSDGYRVELTFLDFNGAAGVCAATYAPGTVHTMAGVSVPACSHSFTPTGLVPPSVPAPEVDDVFNTSDFAVTVTFDRSLIGAITGAASHFVVRINRPAYSPDGALSVVDLPVTAVTALDDMTLSLSLGAGNLSSLQTAVETAAVVYDGAGPLVGAGGPVAPFSASFTPALAEFKPDVADLEHIELSVVASGLLTRIYYTNTQENEHISLAVTASGVLTHVDDL